MIQKIQSLYRGYHYRKHHLPNSILFIKKNLRNANLNLSNNSTDGRINSCKHEDIIINTLRNIKDFKKRLYVPKDRHWFDLIIKDFQYGPLPINIKTTTMKTADNTGNFAMCVYSYTNHPIKLKDNNNNGIMSKIFLQSIKNKKYNTRFKKDYYFIVVNKNNTNDIIANSVLGLSSLTPNINNLPFQVKWNHNRKFIHKNIKNSIKQIKYAIQKPKPSWREHFLSEFRKIE